MSRPDDPIRSYRWQRLAKRVLAEESVCWLCGLPLDYDAPPRSRWAPSVDHVTPRAQGGSLYERSNLRAAHQGCNSRKGDGTRGSGPPVTKRSRAW
jgi:5-methylcytosine-specific restriction endonuclease McrA